MSAPVVFNLSAIDQAMMRIHVRYCLCFPCDNSPDARQTVVARLTSAVRYALTKMPILAGTVTAVAARPGAQQGQLEVRVSLDQLTNFAPTVTTLTHDDFPHSYASLAAAEVPPAWLMSEKLTPLPDNPAFNGGSPAFAVQGSFIDGGFLVAVYMHHSVGDLQGVIDVIKHMSSPAAATAFSAPTQRDLEHAAAQQSQVRSLLAGSPATFPDPSERADPQASPAPVKAADASASASASQEEAAAAAAVEEVDVTSGVLAFDMDKIVELKDAINKGNTDGPAAAVSAFNCLSALLFKGIIKARFPAPVAEDVPSLVLIPVGFRRTLDPPLEGDYYGNACLPAFTFSNVAKLQQPYDTAAIQELAAAVRDSVRGMNDAQVRGAVAGINATPDVSALASPVTDLRPAKMVISSWERLPTGAAAAGLTLGLGAPQYARVISREHVEYFCIVLPRRAEEGLWEVHVELPTREMENLRADAGLMQFVKWVS